jgi:hypothetical protein
VSERFLEGFAVDAKALDALVGTPRVGPKAIRAKLRGKSILRDLDLTLGEGNANRGKPLVDAALESLARGRPRKTDSAYRLTRVATLVLHAYADKLGTIELVPFVEGHPFGLWTPVLHALGMTTLAREYGKSSLAFPYIKRTAKTRVKWPLAMLVGTSLPRWRRELATDWAARLPALPDTPFVHREYGTKPEHIAETKRELVRALTELAAWVAEVSESKRALVLVLDGDQ